jgi:hypothetical protein
LHRLEDSIDVWQTAMPDVAVVRLHGHGRFLHLTALPEIVAALQRAGAARGLAQMRVT